MGFYNSWSKIWLSSWRRKHNKSSLNDTNYCCSLRNSNVIWGLYMHVYDYFLHVKLIASLMYTTLQKCKLLCCFSFSLESWERWLSWLSRALCPKLLTNHSEKGGTGSSSTYCDSANCTLPWKLKLASETQALACTNKSSSLQVFSLFGPVSDMWPPWQMRNLVMAKLWYLAVWESTKLAYCLNIHFPLYVISHDIGLYSPFMQVFRFYQCNK